MHVSTVVGRPVLGYTILDVEIRWRTLVKHMVCGSGI